MIEKTDMLELMAVLGMTMIIKNGIDWTEAQLSGLRKRVGEFNKAYPELTRKFKQEFNGELPPFEFTTELNEWLISFCLAFYIQRHGAKISGSVVGFAKSLLL